MTNKIASPWRNRIVAHFEATPVELLAGDSPRLLRDEALARERAARTTDGRNPEETR
jgi:hypothetical protein